MTASFLLAVGTMRAELPATSPFLPSGGGQAVAPASSFSLELRGVHVEPGGSTFSIFDPAKKSGAWVTIDEPGHEFAVKNFDAQNETVTIEHHGQTRIVAMRTAKIASTGSAPLPPSRPAAVSAPSPITHQAAINSTAASEAALADMQKTIQRRRDERAEAAKQGMSSNGPQPLMNPSGQRGPQPLPSQNPAGPQVQRSP